MEKPYYDRWWVYFILLILLVLFTISMKKELVKKQAGDILSDSVQMNTPLSEKKPGAVPRTAISVNATELFLFFKKEEEAALKQYKKKWLKLTETVSDTHLKKDAAYIIIAEDPSRDIGGIQCLIKDKKHLEKLKNLKKGQKITLVGRCVGRVLNKVQLDNTYIRIEE